MLMLNGDYNLFISFKEIWFLTEKLLYQSMLMEVLNLMNLYLHMNNDFFFFFKVYRN
jgi:hypothetical protein